MGRKVGYRGLGGLCALLTVLVACDPTSATNKQAEQKSIGWCQICRTWCDTELRLLPTDTILRTYRQAAMYHGYGKDRGGDAWEALERLVCIVKASDRETRQAFIGLLDDNDMAVRYCAAVHSLGHGFARDAAVQVLEEIAEGPGLLALTAEIKLLDWEAGITVEL